ncbi:MAG: hypothetical protein IJM40_05565, partial [Synergistaceae bacterium]|nr:hypothetical protein [Synergistaceae bacterium]
CDSERRGVGRGREREVINKPEAKPERRKNRGLNKSSRNNIKLDDDDYEFGEININNKNKKLNKFNKSKKDVKDAGDGVKHNKFKFKKNKGKGKPRRKGE